MNDNINKEVITLPPFKKFCMTIGELPSSYIETMTYYETLVWLCNYLSKTVIPAINNNAAAVTELQGLFTELQDYVNNYFDNLDVQEEINNKLDDMADSGELEEIIAQFLELNCILTFNTLEDLKSGDNLINGSVAKTLGRTTYNDGNGALYKVREITSSDVVDNDNIIALDISNELIGEKIPDNIQLKFYSVAESPATYITIFPSGKTMFIDTGRSQDWTNIKNCIDSLGITKFDIGIITHFHSDHSGNIQNMFDNYDLTNCTIYVGMKPDFANHSADIDQLESDYDDIITLITSNGVTPIVPQNNSIVNVDYNTKLRFLNTDSNIALNYYGRYKEYGTEEKINFNDFSLITEIIHENVKILSTGDIERPVEEQYTSYLGKCNLMTAPHHGVNQDGYEGFFYATCPEFALCNFPTTSDSWLDFTHKEINYLTKNGTHIVSTRWSVASNGFFKFISDGDNLYSEVKGNGLINNFNQYGIIYLHPLQLVNSTYNNDIASITLLDLINNMIPGSTISFRWYSDYTTSWATLYSNIRALLPLDNNMIVEIKKNYQTNYTLRIYNNEIEFRAVYRDNQWLNTYGEGLITTNISETQTSTKLMDLIDTLPRGKYQLMIYNDNYDTVLSADINYSITLNIIYNYSNRRIATLEAISRSPNLMTSSNTNAAIGAYDSGITNKFAWVKVC